MAAICLDICSAPCKALGHCCIGCEKGCDKGCSALCSCHCCPKDRPSPIFLTYTLLFNVPVAAIGVIYGVVSFLRDDSEGSCDMFLHPGIWLFVAAALAAFFIVFAIRIYLTFSNQHVPKPEEGNAVSSSHAEKPARKSFIDKLWFTACHDVAVFLFFFAAPFSLVWSIAGMAGSGDDLDGCENVRWAVGALGLIGLVYLVGSVCVGAMSCCCEVSRMQKYDAQAHAAGAHAAIPTAALAGDKPTKPHSSFLDHLQGSGFMGHKPFPGRHNESALPPAAAPPYAQAPPAEHMATPEVYEKPQAGSTATGAAPPADSLYGRMKNAFHHNG